MSCRAKFVLTLAARASDEARCQRGPFRERVAPVAVLERGWLAGGYNNFLSYLGANPDFRQLTLSGTQRVLAPGTAIMAFEQKVIPAPLMDGSYLKEYIEQVWAKFAGVDPFAELIDRDAASAITKVASP